MRLISQPRLAVLTLVCGAAFAGSAAMAQTSSGSDTQSQINPSSSQSKSFLDSLGSLPTQSSSSMQNPSVGDTVPDNVQLHPMPDDAASAVPSAKDHHVAKTDNDTAVIAHPDSRKVVGVVSDSDSTASTSDSSSDDSDGGDSTDSMNSTTDSDSDN